MISIFISYLDKVPGFLPKCETWLAAHPSLQSLFLLSLQIQLWFLLLPIHLGSPRIPPLSPVFLEGWSAGTPVICWFLHGGMFEVAPQGQSPHHWGFLDPGWGDVGPAPCGPNVHLSLLKSHIITQNFKKKIDTQDVSGQDNHDSFLTIVRFSSREEFAWIQWSSSRLLVHWRSWSMRKSLNTGAMGTYDVR